MEENTVHKNWFGRNWKWVVPTGGCLLVIVLFITLAGTMFMGVSSIFKDSEPYQKGMSAAQTNEVVLEALGEPIESDGMTKGSINYTNGDSHSNLEIPLKGPKGEATLRIVADKYTDKWEYQVLEVILEETNETVSLLNEVIPLDNN